MQTVVLQYDGMSISCQELPKQTEHHMNINTTKYMSRWSCIIIRTMKWKLATGNPMVPLHHKIISSGHHRKFTVVGPVLEKITGYRVLSFFLLITSGAQILKKTLWTPLAVSNSTAHSFQRNASGKKLTSNPATPLYESQHVKIEIGILSLALKTGRV